MTKAAIYSLMLVLITNAARVLGASSPTEIGAKVDQVIDQALAEKRIVGTVVLVAHDGNIIYQRAAGLADREAGKAMQLDSIFRLASLSKPIVSAAAMALIARRTLSLDDRVDKWLPDFHPKLATGESPPITIKELLTHTAGFDYLFSEPPNGPYHQAGVSDGLDQPGLSMPEEVRRVASVPLLSPPGQNWHYSVAMDVLGAVVERAAGKPLPKVVETLVTGPLGMRDTGFAVVDAKRLVVPYADAVHEPKRMSELERVPFGPPSGAGLVFVPARAFDLRSFPSGGAGMVGTAPDFLRLLEVIRKGGGPILPRSSVEAMMSDEIGDLPVDMMGSGWGFGYGGAVLVDPEAARSPQTRGTWRWGGVYGESWFVEPAHNLTVVEFSNTALAGMRGQFPTELRDAIYSALSD